MIEIAQPRIREALAQCRAIAYLGQPQDAIRRAEASLSEIPNGATVGDRLAIGMFKAEILHLDGNGEDALRVFDSEIEPLLPLVPHECQIVAAHNRSDISFGLLKPDEMYYNVLDESKVGGVNIWNSQALYNATQDAAAGKPYESFPTFWQELLRTYRQGCWRAFRPVCQHMAEQCIRLNLVERAIYYVILAEAEETACHIGSVLLQHGTHDSLNIAVRKVLACAQLKRHFLVACDLLDSMMDAVPDELVKDVCTWLLTRAVGAPVSHTELDVVQSAWRVLAKLAARVEADQASELVDAATSHPCWLAGPEPNRVNLVREKIIAAVAECVDKLSKAAIATLAAKAVPLATNRKQDFDYGATISLLCQLTTLGPPEIKEALRKELYPSGQQLNAILVQIAPTFGHPIQDSSSWADNAKRIAENVRMQVQRVPKDAEPRPVHGSCMQHTANVGDDKLVCSISGTVDIHAIFRHREWVPNKALAQVVDAILDMIESPDNILENKIALIQTLRLASWQRSKKQQRRLWRLLSSLAKGDVKEPAHVMSWAEANDPMNPFKMRSGNPTDVRGMSLFVLACLEKEQPGISGAELDKMIEVGLSDRDANVRAYAFAAAREKPAVSEAVVMAVLLGTRDSDEKAARAALFALAEKSELKLSRPQWRLLVQSIRFAKQNRSPHVRSAAARSATRLMPVAPTGALRQEIADLVAEFATDTCYTVRSETKAS